MLYDFGDAVMVATVTVAFAIRYSEEPYHPFSRIKRIVDGPTFWAPVLDVLLSVTGTAVPTRIEAIVDPLAQMTAPSILIELGIFLSFSLKNMRFVGLAPFIRVGFGLLFGLGFAYLVGLEGETLVVVAMSGGASIGFMALTFSSLA